MGPPLREQDERLLERLARRLDEAPVMWVQWECFTLAHAWRDGEEESMCGNSFWPPTKGLKGAPHILDCALDPEWLSEPMPSACEECLYGAGIGPRPGPPPRFEGRSWDCRRGEHLGCDGQRCVPEAERQEDETAPCECPCHQAVRVEWAAPDSE